MSERLRCAIYTRKSTEEGLDQNFNSLDAQREACEAYIRSQAGEGWRCIKTAYDDGGFSGGSMERPALKALLADIERGLIDIIVVYKVDRLTRSLADFARMVDVFDKAKVSFVSVTQAFNTTTSMGRLTLNILLSFAQFEREVTGERIRDKVAASKAKGIWMGGVPPLGYDIKDRALVINEAEAALVRRIFARYIELRSTKLLARELAEQGARTKAWTSRAGRAIGGCVFSHGAINHILTARIYRGEIAHKDKVHAGAHEAIIDAETWERVVKILEDRAPKFRDEPRMPGRAPLTGLLFDDAGNPMSPTHTRKGGRRYSYYCSAALLHDKKSKPGQFPRLPGAFVEDAVLAEIGARLCPAWFPDERKWTRLRAAIARIDVTSAGLVATVKRAALPAGQASDGEVAMRLTITGPLVRRGGGVAFEMRGRPPKLSHSLLRAVVMARRWAQQLASGEAASVRALARDHGLCHLYVGKLLPLAFLAPDLVQMILEGRQPRGLSISNLLAEPLPLTWPGQRARFRGAN